MNLLTTILSEIDLGELGDATIRPPSTTVVVDFLQAQSQRFTLIGDLTVHIDTAALPIGNYQLRCIQDGIGGRTLNFAPPVSDCRWLNCSSQPPINTGPEGETIMRFYWDGAEFTQEMARVGAA